MEFPIVGPHNRDMGTDLQTNLRARMQELGMTEAAPLAEEAGLKESFVRDILRGKSRMPKADNLAKLARALRTTPEALLGVEPPRENKAQIVRVDGLKDPIPLSPQPVPYGGEVRAGGFISVDDYFAQDADEAEVPPSVMKHPKFIGLRQFAWHVQGNSMDQAKIADGMWVVAIPYLDYVDQVGDLSNGLPVIVERTRFGGSEIERTIKEVQFSRGGMRLVPRSSEKHHRELFIPFDNGADNDTEEVKVLAVVISAVTDFTSPQET